jgi:hypothetical protein
MFISIFVKSIVLNKPQDTKGVHVIKQSVVYSATGKLVKGSDYIRNKSQNLQFMSCVTQIITLQL